MMSSRGVYAREAGGTPAPLDPRDGAGRAAPGGSVYCAVNAMTSSTGEAALTRTHLNLPGARRGKVRDLYRIPGGSAGEPDRVLMIATDRISAFDVVLPTPIPGKGRILGTMSAWWLRWIESHGLARTHLLSTDPADIPDVAFSPGCTPREALAGRVLIGRICNVIKVECVVRGYLEGSGWKEYQERGSVCGIALPRGLVQCSRLPEPIFTPTTKAEPPAHDTAVTFEEACEIAGRGMMERLRATSLAIYHAAAAHALSRGIIIADCKFEFGLPVGERDPEPILIDEALTPDASRFWPADKYEPGHAQPSYDKQFVREYLEGIVARGGWNKSAPGPELPREIVEATVERYRTALTVLTGSI